MTTERAPCDACSMSAAPSLASERAGTRTVLLRALRWGLDPATRQILTGAPGLNDRDDWDGRDACKKRSTRRQSPAAPCRGTFTSTACRGAERSAACDGVHRQRREPEAAPAHPKERQ